MNAAANWQQKYGIPRSCFNLMLADMYGHGTHGKTRKETIPI
jgi:hypothetical protein